MASNRTDYVFRTTRPDVLERDADAVVRMEAYDTQGRLAVPTLPGSTFELIGPTGQVIVAAAPVTIVDEVATFTIDAADLPDTLAFSTLYQERWVLLMPDGTTRRPRRRCALSRYLLELPVSEDDLVSGRHPDLRAQLGQYGKSLFPYIDSAWSEVLRRLWKVNRWPELMLSTSAFQDVVREEAYAAIFEFLFRQTAGTNRWERLMDKHEARAQAEWDQLKSLIDADLDGLADSEDMISPKRLTHRNGGARRRILSTGRY